MKLAINNFQNVAFRPLSQTTSDILIFGMLDGMPLAKGTFLVVFIHNEGMFIPSIGMSPELVGQVRTRNH